MNQPCRHNYALTPNLSPDPSLPICAVCFMETCINDIKIAQAALARRGDIFESSKAGPSLCTTDSDDKKWVSHKDRTRQWMRAKANCWRLVAALEKLQDEEVEMVKERGVNEALYLWELAKDERWQVPGFRYAEFSVSKEGKLITRPQATKAASNSVPTEEASSEGGWEMIRRRSKKRPQPFTNSPQDEHTQLNTDEVIPKAMEGVNNRLEDLSLTPKNCFKLFDKDSEGAITAVVDKATGNPISILNGNATSTALHPRKSVNIDAQATIIPSDDALATLVGHHEHTIAEKSHNRLSFNRNSHSYTPSCWVSPEGYEKDDTSYCKASWLTVDQLQGEIARSERDLDKGDEALVEKAETVASEQEKETEYECSEHVSTFQRSLPPWQSGEEISSMKRGIHQSITKGWVSIPDNGDGVGPTLTLPWFHRLELMSASKKCNRALVQEEKEKKRWTDAESER